MIDETHGLDLHAIQAIYPGTLYSIDHYSPEPVVKPVSAVHRKVLILTREKLQPNDTLYTFLQGILGACKLTMEQVNLVSGFRQEEDHKQLIHNYGPSTVIMFGVETADIRLPVFFPHFQAQTHDGVVYISSPDLSVIENDKPEKQKLWQSLKKAFSL